MQWPQLKLKARLRRWWNRGDQWVEVDKKTQLEPKFAWVPRSCSDGTWRWLEPYYVEWRYETLWACRKLQCQVEDHWCRKNRRHSISTLVAKRLLNDS